MTRAPARTDPVTPLLDGIDLVIFDFDGVIADSEVISLGSLHHALADFGIDIPLNSVRERFLGTSIATILHHVAASTTSRDATQFADHWQEKLFDQFQRDLTPVPGVVSLLDRLDAAGPGYAIASSSSFQRLRIALQAMDLTDRFDHVFSAQQVDRGKPAPDLFEFAARKLDTPPARCLVIEDSPFGVQGAKAAGMRCAGFVGGAHLVEIRDDHAATLERAGADAILDSFAGIAAG